MLKRAKIMTILKDMEARPTLSPKAVQKVPVRVASIILI